MANFVERVIADIESGNFYKNHKEAYFNATYIMDNQANVRSCAVDDGWSVYLVDCIFWHTVRLERGHHKVELTRKEKRMLLKAFKKAMNKLIDEREIFLKSLRD